MDDYIIQQIISNLDIDDKLTFSRTCHRFHDIVYKTGFSIYNIFTDKELTINECIKLDPRYIMLHGSYNNSHTLINYAIKQGSRDWLFGLFGACGGGHDNLIDEMYNKCSKIKGWRTLDYNGTNDIQYSPWHYWHHDSMDTYSIWHTGLSGACFKHQIRIIKRIQQHFDMSTANQDCANWSCIGGHMDLITMFENGHSRFTFPSACFGGNLDVVKMTARYIDNGKTKIYENGYEGIENACLAGHLHIVKYLMPQEVDIGYFNDLLLHACNGGHCPAQR